MRNSRHFFRNLVLFIGVSCMAAFFTGCASNPQPRLIPEGMNYKSALEDWGSPKAEVSFGQGPICVWKANRRSGESGHLVVAFDVYGNVREAWFREGPFNEQEDGQSLHETFGR